MIDLHIHSTHSDGTASVLEILKKAEELNLRTISITDHENCNAHKELNSINVKEFYSGEILTGIELKTQYNNSTIDILGYNIDCEIMSEFLKECYEKLSRDKIEEKKLKEYYKYAAELDLKLTPISELEWDKTKDWASVVFYRELKNHEENREKLPKDLWESFLNFKRNYYKIEGKTFYVNASKYYPTLDKIIDIIHKSGGKAFIAHVYEYVFIENKIEELENIIQKYDIDGIECYHSSFTDAEIATLLEFCNKNNLLMSGGSDYHGANKPNIDLAIGKGNLKIPDNIIHSWNKI